MSNASPLISLRYPDRFFIGGNWVEPSSDSKFTVISPHTEEAFLTVPEAQEADINRAVAAARQAFDTGPWPRMTPAVRAGYMNAIAAKLMERTVDLAHAWTNEAGVSNGFAHFAAPAASSIYTYYAEMAGTFPFEERHEPSMGGGTGLLVREAVGVVAAIIPWNGPLILASYKIAPALLAGCTVILKASPEAPIDAYIFAEICEAAGLPPGVLNVVTADRAVSELLVRHQDVDKVSFTGSSAAGKRIASICGERIARCTLELGGKSAAILLDDYDLETAAQSLTQSLSMLNGQVCAALTRVVIPKKRHNAFVDALAASFQTLTVGDPYDPNTQVGPLAMKRQLDRVESYIAKGKAEGATLAQGGGRPAGLNRGWFIEPTIFSNVDGHAIIAQEEIFGPVISVIPVEDENDAVRVANDSMFGLNSSVFTNDIDAAYRIGRQLRSGTVGHNGFRNDFTIAFGGFKQSGLGREGGREGLLPYLETKTMLFDGDPSHVKVA
jgi:aldehyde dehydrogenase (NAD+)